MTKASVRRLLPIALAVVIVAALAWFFRPAPATAPAPALTESARPAPGAALVEVALPETLSDRAQIGKRGFEAKCLACHGTNAAGQQGVAPPLVHKLYEPSHHSDAAFVMAAKNGVRAHHWPFGNMLPVAGLTDADALAIAAYVRELQRANGIN